MHDNKVTLKKVEEDYYEAYYEGRRLAGGTKEGLKKIMTIIVQGIRENDKKLT